MLITAAFSLPAAAQTAPGDQPAWQLYGGTSFLWAKTRDQLSPYNLSTINEWGWQTDITEYPWHWFGGTLESSGFYGRPTVFDPATGQNYGNLLNLKSYTIMFGPTFTYTHSYRVQPFGHVLLGGVNSQCTNMHSYQACQLINGQPGNYSQWIFGWALGGGADVRVSRLVAIRGQFDWLPTTFNNLYNDRQNNLRVSVGLVFRFGGTDSTRSQLKPPPPVPPSNSSGDMSSNSVPAAPQPVAQQSQPVTAVAQQILSPTPIAPPVNTPPGTPQVNTAPAASQAQVAKAAPPVMSTPASASAPPAQTQAAVKEQDAPPSAPTTLSPAHDLQPGGGTGAQPAVVPPPAPATPAAAPTQAQSPAQAPDAMVEFWSNPTGAEVEIDGQYVGNTYSTIAVPPGEHTIRIHKQDYSTWERTILITSGDVRVAAYLEQTRAIITFH